MLRLDGFCFPRGGSGLLNSVRMRGSVFHGTRILLCDELETKGDFFRKKLCIYIRKGRSMRDGWLDWKSRYDY